MSTKKENLDRNLPTIAIVGRPNVGKSSLFNAIIGRRMSIVHEESGVTRDRVASAATHNGKRFQLVDTGGLGTLMGKTRGVDMWDECISEQVEVAVADADVLLFVVNVQEGLLTLDEEVASRLRTVGKPVIMVANKSDNPKLAEGVFDFSELGYSEIIPVSCLHRSGVKEVMDLAVNKLPEFVSDEEEGDAADKVEPFKIAVVGRPNVGKSSLVNALLGEERVIVSDIAGTTRDAVDIDFELMYQGEKHPAVLVDTAGLRRKGKIDNVVEYFSAMRAQSAIERADLVLFVVESSADGVTAQDKNIAGIIERTGRACILVSNKFDLVRDEHKTFKLEERLRYFLPSMSFAPLVHVSAKDGTNLDILLDLVAHILELVNVKVPTSVLNRVLQDAIEFRSPPVISHAPLKLYYASMIGTRPPRFLLFVNDPKYCGGNYLTYLKNSLRSAFDFTGLPIDVKLRARPKKVRSFHTPSRSSRKSKRKK